MNSLMLYCWDMTDNPKPSCLISRLFRFAAWSAAVVVIVPLAFYGFLHIDHNQHVVEPGVLYRSAQLPAAEFTAFAQRTGLRTVINLRGENIGRDWYDAQFQAAQAMGVGFINYRMSAKKELTPAQMAELAHILKSAPKPVLIHCGSGSDRSGLACALYLYEEGRSPAEVAGQLSLRFGHFPYLWSGSWAMDDSLKAHAENSPSSARKLANVGEN